MPRKNAAQGDGKDSGILLIDDRTKAVMTDQPRHAQEAFKGQIARVHEVVPSRSRDDVALVLQYHEGNVDKAIQSFMEDGAKTVLNEWQSHGKKGKSANKRNKKKKRGPDTQDEKPSGGDTAPPNKAGGASSTTQAVNSHPAPSTRPSTKQRPPSSQQPRQYQQQPNRRDRDGDHNRGRPHPRDHPGEGRGGDGKRPGRQQPGNQAASNRLPADSGKPRPEKGHRSHHTPSHDDMVERLLPTQTDEMVHHTDSELHYQDAAKAKKLVAVLERSTKDLHRTSIALTRHKALLQDKLNQSEKSIPKSFDEVQRFLNERKLALTNEFLEVKQEASEMLEAREEKAKELERKTHRAATMSEEQVQELRAEIKQFVSDRKVDEEIGKALRFTWNPDKLIDLIKNFGEVIPVQHHYTTRRPSISSLSSFNTISRTTSVSEDHGPLSARSISLTESQDSVSKPLSPRRTNDIDMKAEVAEMAAKLQRSMTQGRKGARNQGGPNPDNKGDRSQQPNRNQGQGQQPHSNQGQGGPNPNKQGRNQNRQDKPQGQHGSRQGQQGSKQGPVSQQGQRPQEQKPQGQRPQGQRPQGQRPQGQGQRQGQQQHQRNGNEEQDGQKKENPNAKRRQNRKQKERKQIDNEEATSAQASNGTTGPADKPEKKQVDERTNLSNNVPVSILTPADTPQPTKAPEAVPEPKKTEQEKQEITQDSVSVPTPADTPQMTKAPEVVPEPKETEQEKQEITQDSVSVPAPADAPQPSKVPEVVPVPKETEQEKQEIKEDAVHDSHVNEVEKPESLDSQEKDMGKLNEGVKDALAPKISNGPLKNGDVNMNGDIKMNGEVPHVNGDIIPNDKINGSIEVPLPQREMKSRRSHKIEEVVKENSALNGVTEFEPTEREN